MFVDGEKLLLVRGELLGVALQARLETRRWACRRGMEGGKQSYLDCTKDGMGLAGNSYYNRTLLHCLGSIFNLEYSALGRAVQVLATLRDPLGAGGVQCDGIVVVVVSKHGEVRAALAAFAMRSSRGAGSGFGGEGRREWRWSVSRSFSLGDDVGVWS